MIVRAVVAALLTLAEFASVRASAVDPGYAPADDAAVDRQISSRASGTGCWARIDARRSPHSLGRPLWSELRGRGVGPVVADLGLIVDGLGSTMAISAAPNRLTPAPDPCQSALSSVRRPHFLSRLSCPILGVAVVPRSVARRGSARRSEKWRYTHLQREGDKHSGSGNRGAASLKKRLSRSPTIAGHAKGPATTLTECHGCLVGAAGFVFVTINATIPRPVPRIQRPIGAGAG